jgi:hypothetical protein
MAAVWTSSTQDSGNANANLSNRPVILKRPFRSVAELGYVFSDTPWRNLDFFTPESGFAPLLDAFCINDSSDSQGMVAGKVDLNTRQPLVLRALLAGTLRDELQSSTLPAGEVDDIAKALIKRTTDLSTPGAGPLPNVADLVGRYGTGFNNGAFAPAPAQPFDGFSKDLALYIGGATSPNNLVQRLRETAMRSFSDTGQVGTWNLMVDLVAQTGRFPASATGPNQFSVDGETRFWIHLAIDRQTGTVIDKQIETVNE